MKVIRKVEIKNFRSFLGTTVNDRSEIQSITDLNIFSGSNDSGKSNLLRALNLFFNDEIDNVNKFRFNSDFNIFKQDTVQKIIEIKIYFIINKRKFSISKFYNREGYRNFEYRFTEKGGREEIVIDSRANTNKIKYKDNEAVLKKESGYKRAATRVMQSVSFSYVPAIREGQFFSHLYGKIIYKIKLNEEKLVEKLSTEYKKIERWERTQKNISENQDFLENLNDETWRKTRLVEISSQISGISSLDDAIKELESQINTFSDKLFSSVEFLSSKFKVGSNLIAFFESFDIDKVLKLVEPEDNILIKVSYCQYNFLKENFLQAEAIAIENIQKSVSLIKVTETEDLGWLVVRRSLASCTRKDVSKTALSTLISNLVN